MAVYLIAQVEVHDTDAMGEYIKKAWPTIGPCDAVGLVEDDEPRVLEGQWHGPRPVVLKFASQEEVMAWYNSAEYQEAAKLRWEAAKTNAAIAEGAD